MKLAAELGFEPRVALIQSQACCRYTTPQYILFTQLVLSDNDIKLKRSIQR